MTDDIEPMATCPTEKHGAHALSAVLPTDETGDLTLFCERCGALRRVPVSGPMSPLDAKDAATILRAALP